MKELPIKNTRRTFQVIETLMRNGTASLPELVDELDAPRSTVHDYVKSLEELKYVVNRNGRYRVSSRFLAIGVSARNQMQIFRLAEPELDRLAAQTGEHASLMIEEHGLGVLLAIEKGENALDLGVRVGWRLELPTNAPGKAILANLPEDDLESILDEHGLPQITGRTITDPGALNQELEAIRERGFATDIGERVDGVRAVSVPVVSEEKVLGAIAISGPTNRMKDERFETELPDLLLRTANVIEVQYTLEHTQD